MSPLCGFISLCVGRYLFVIIKNHAQVRKHLFGVSHLFPCMPMGGWFRVWIFILSSQAGAARRGSPPPFFLFSRSALASFLPAVHLLRQLLHPPRHLLGRSLPAYSLSVLFSRTRLLC